MNLIFIARAQSLLDQALAVRGKLFWKLDLKGDDEVSSLGRILG